MQRSNLFALNVALAMGKAALDYALPSDPIPRKDRHGKFESREETQFTTPRKKSSSLQRLLKR